MLVTGNFCSSHELDKPSNPITNDKMTKLKAFADYKLTVAKMTISLSDRVENAGRKEENAGYQHFLLFPQCFPKPSSSGAIKSELFGKDLSLYYRVPTFNNTDTEAF